MFLRNAGKFLSPHRASRHLRQNLRIRRCADLKSPKLGTKSLKTQVFEVFPVKAMNKDVAKNPSSHCTGGWVGPAAGLNNGEEKISILCRDSNPRP